VTTHGVAPYPLYWPLTQPRTKAPTSAWRWKVDFSTARGHLVNELRLLEARDVVISTNLPLRRDGLPMVPDREPTDAGVAVYFTRKGKPYVLACDAYDRIRWNIRAVGLTVEALRSIERAGATSMLEQAFSGFAALPPKGNVKHWRDVLGFAHNVLLSAESVRTAYLELVRIHHPDVGGDTDRMAEINRAFEDALAELGAT
jgi:hypothetical protein